METKKKNRFWGRMLLSLLFTLLILYVANDVVLISPLKGRFTSGTMLGSGYDYNPIFYLAGSILYLAGAFMVYKKILEPKMNLISGFKAGAKVLYFIFLILFVILGFLGSIIISICRTGLFDNIGPNIMYGIVTLGYPLVAAVFMTIQFIKTVNKKAIWSYDSLEN